MYIAFEKKKNIPNLPRQLQSEKNTYIGVFNKTKLEKILPMIDCEFTEAPIYNNLKLTRVKCGNNIIDN